MWIHSYSISLCRCTLAPRGWMWHMKTSQQLAQRHCGVMLVEHWISGWGCHSSPWSSWLKWFITSCSAIEQTMKITLLTVTTASTVAGREMHRTRQTAQRENHATGRRQADDPKKLETQRVVSSYYPQTVTVWFFCDTHYAMCWAFACSSNKTGQPMQTCHNVTSRFKFQSLEYTEHQVSTIYICGRLWKLELSTWNSISWFIRYTSIS